MERTEQKAVVLEIMNQLVEHDSWCGETHIQKCAYLIQEGLGLPTQFEFVLYKFGPFSFDLRDLLGEMRADMLIDLRVRHSQYRPTLSPSHSGTRLLERHDSVVDPHKKTIALVTAKFGDCNVSELERIGTALHVRKESQRNLVQQARRLTELKPHVGYAAALEAVKEVDDFLNAGTQAC